MSLFTIHGRLEAAIALKVSITSLFKSFQVVFAVGSCHGDLLSWRIMGRWKKGEKKKQGASAGSRQPTVLRARCIDSALYSNQAQRLAADFASERLLATGVVQLQRERHISFIDPLKTDALFPPFLSFFFFFFFSFISSFRFSFSHLSCCTL
jgi:hypothetical protein